MNIQYSNRERNNAIFLLSQQTDGLIRWRYVSELLYTLTQLQIGEIISLCMDLSTTPKKKNTTLQLRKWLANNIFKTPPDTINERE